MAPVLRSETRRQSEVAEATEDGKGKFKVPPPHLPFEVRQMILDEYITAALAAMPELHPVSRTPKRRAYQRAQLPPGDTLPSLATLQSVSYAFYRDELLPALNRAIRIHTAKHAALKEDLLAKEVAYAADKGRDVEFQLSSPLYDRPLDSTLVRGEMFGRRGVRYAAKRRRPGYPHFAESLKMEEEGNAA